MDYFKIIWNKRSTIHKLAVHKVKLQYADQSFGIAWALIKPLVTVFSFWFFFKIGLRSGSPVDGQMFILWLFGGNMIWMLTSEVIGKAPKVIQSNSVLVTTIKFPVMTLPIIEVLSSLYVHIGVMFIMFFIFVLIGGTTYLPDIYYLNFIYYWFTFFVFFVGFSILIAPLGVLIKDVSSFIGAILMPLFWMTPVLWNPQTELIALLEKLFNPFYYFVVGYRETLLYNTFFFEEIWYDIYIWLVIGLIYVIGFSVWKKSRGLMPDLI